VETRCFTGDISAPNWLSEFITLCSSSAVRKENMVALHRAEIRMVRWMCGVKLKDRLASKELRERD